MEPALGTLDGKVEEPSRGIPSYGGRVAEPGGRAEREPLKVACLRTMVRRLEGADSLRTRKMREASPAPLVPVRPASRYTRALYVQPDRRSA